MTDFSIRSDSVDVEQIMRQIRARIREKRGVDYTEEEIRELANVKLEKFLDPRGVRSDLIEQFRKKREATLPPNFAFEDTTLFETHRAPLRFIRRLLRPILKLFFNPNPLIEALHIQSKLNAQQAALEPLYYEVIHNLVLETTRLGIEVKNLKMRVESMSSRLDFDERRARALEGVVQYRPGAVPPLQPPTGIAGASESSERSERRRRRRRRGRRPADAREQSSTGSGAAGAADAREQSSAGFGAAGSADAREQFSAGSGATGAADTREQSSAGFGAAGSAGPRDGSNASITGGSDARDAARPWSAPPDRGERRLAGSAGPVSPRAGSNGYPETDPAGGGPEDQDES